MMQGIPGWVDPAIPPGQSIVTREWLTIVINDIIALGCYLSIAQENGIARGAGTEGLESLLLQPGQMLANHFGRIVAIGPPSAGEIIGRDANGHADFLSMQEATLAERVKFLVRF